MPDTVKTRSPPTVPEPRTAVAECPKPYSINPSCLLNIVAMYGKGRSVTVSSKHPGHRWIPDPSRRWLTRPVTNRPAPGCGVLPVVGQGRFGPARGSDPPCSVCSDRRPKPLEEPEAAGGGAGRRQNGSCHSARSLSTCPLRMRRPRVMRRPDSERCSKTAAGDQSGPAQQAHDRREGESLGLRSTPKSVSGGR
jgi:hypothetical protein